MLCWKCQKELEPPKGMLPFRAECDYCHAWLHVCKNCRYYKPGLPNDCMVPGTDPIADREQANYCDEFSLRLQQPEKTGSADQAARRLFGEEIKKPQPPKDHFDGLFKD